MNNCENLFFIYLRERRTFIDMSSEKLIQTLFELKHMKVALKTQI
jgi:hypothetical protein